MDNRPTRLSPFLMDAVVVILLSVVAATVLGTGPEKIEMMKQTIARPGNGLDYFLVLSSQLTVLFY